MKRYHYVRLSGYLPVVSEDLSLVSWYLRVNTHVVNGVTVGKKGESVAHGEILASSEREAYQKVREM